MSPILLALMPLLCQVLPLSPGCSDFVYGGWEWLQTENASGEIVSPATTGFTEQLLFGSEGGLCGSFIRYRDDVAIYEGSWYWTEIIAAPYMIEQLIFEDEIWCFSVIWEDPCRLVLQDTIQLPNGNGTPPSVTRTYEYVGEVPADARTWGGLKALYR